MTEVVTSTLHPSERPAFLATVSWGSVFAGLVLSLVVYLVLSTLGTAIGATAIDPMEAGNPFRGFGVGASIWAGLTTLIAIAVGGFTAGYLSRHAGALHGLLAWALTTLVTAYLLLSATGAALSAAGSAAKTGLGAIGAVAGAGVTAAGPAIGDTLRNEMNEAGISLDARGLQNELETLLRQTGKAELQPEQLRDQAETAAQQGQSQARHAAENPQAAGDDLRQWLSRVTQRAGQALDAADKDALVNIIVARTGKSRAEAQQIADNYEQTYNKAVQRYREAKAEAEQKAREAGAAAARSIAKGSWGTLAVLLIGALVAAGAGAMGFRRRRPEVIVV